MRGWRRSRLDQVVPEVEVEPADALAEEMRSEPGAPRWWGWGDPSKRVPLHSAARTLLREELGPSEPAAAVSLGAVGMPEPLELPGELVEVLGREAFLTGREHRLRRATGSGYPDLVRLRRGRLEDAPDAVAFPASAEQVATVLEVCAREGVAVVPFGGGTSVVGGVDPLRGPFERLIALDLRRLRGIDLDSRSRTALLGPGLRGPEAEAALAAEGFTLGHFPQSFERATIGGFAATRSAGQASSGYGRFDDLVCSVELTAPAGRLRTVKTPHSAAGPALRELVLGSEGVLGVITEVGVRVHPLPEARRYEAWIAPDFERGEEAVRGVAQDGCLPDVIRVSDETETRVSMAFAGITGARRRALDAYLRLRRRRRGCLVVCGWEGEPAAIERRRAPGAALLRSAGAVPLGRGAGEAWLRSRYQGPYVRDELLDLGYLVETLETAHTWAGLGKLHGEVGEAITTALEAEGTPGIVMCHISHAYADGASLYYTVIAPRRVDAEIAQWQALKAAASDAIVAAGGTITHHHAVGRDHAPYMRAEVGEMGLDALRALKQRLDPAGIMNPGKLLPG
jgi:alkyldihydroxyacetonephosphate synthase